MGSEQSDEAARERSLERVTAAAGTGALRSRLAVCAAAVAAAAACTGVAFAQRSAIPDEALLLDVQRAKLDDFASRSGDFDLVFFGSSHLYRGIVPEDVDRRLAELGRPHRSYNLAFAAGYSFETDALVRRVVPRWTRRPRWAVIELPDWIAESRNRDTTRDVAWHDAAETWNALSTLRGNASPGDSVALAFAHCRSFVMRSAGIGLGPTAARYRADPDSDVYRRSRSALEETRGASVIDPQNGSGDGADPGDDETDDEPDALRHERFVRRRGAYERDVGALAAGGGPARGPKRYPVEALRRQQEFLRASGVEAVYVVAPVPWRTPYAAEAAAAGGARVLAFNDPGDYPELLAFENRFDVGHLNAAGAAAFSRRFADAFDALLARGPGAAR